ncbi:MAG: hypothetical protein KDB03_24875 [Planctomycetales bacterium]|nr:hypothetical protein [Planctomycetales bacterium]
MNLTFLSEKGEEVLGGASDGEVANPVQCEELRNLYVTRHPKTGFRAFTRIARDCVDVLQWSTSL